MASLITPTAATTATQKPLTPLPPRATTTAAVVPGRRNFLSLSAAALFLAPAAAAPPRAAAEADDEYVKETEEVISKVRATITLDKTDPNIAAAVAELRETSNTWVAKYRREKALLGRASFRDMYSALNAVSGHYISFGPTAPIPAKRKQRILEEVETAEKALLRGR
ncbi:photosystem II repair protein PSB27-H1, chloroplastic-like [Salvia divinorum]|uniref:Photosystem II repair protein PSB27-H1, chloroplastic-like n=1 Tax=Salvia divinorum TaxID=28513 RepID=A0ABD1HGM1_SALDI